MKGNARDLNQTVKHISVLHIRIFKAFFSFVNTFTLHDIINTPNHIMLLNM